MRAALFDRFGQPGVLRVAELPDPEPGPGQVRVRVRAAGVQPFDVAVRRGEMSWLDRGKVVLIVEPADQPAGTPTTRSNSSAVGSGLP